MTQEQIKAAVLAECERLCPKPESEWDNGLFRITAWQSKWPQTWELYTKTRSGEWLAIATFYAFGGFFSDYSKRSLDMFSFVLGLNKPPADPKWEFLKKFVVNNLKNAESNEAKYGIGRLDPFTSLSRSYQIIAEAMKEIEYKQSKGEL